MFINMLHENEYSRLNKEAWNKKTEIHVRSSFYNNEQFIKGENSLKSIELSLLGDLTGKSVLHLQCHFGQDSISLARMGAKVTAVDFSEKAIHEAKVLAEITKQDVHFICCDVYDLPAICNEKFDIVFTSYGVIGWLPDMNKWAHVVSHFLKPNGRFVFVEFHPVVWMFDNDFQLIAYNYFKDKAIIETENGTYADRSSSTTHTTVTWNHSLSEVMTALMSQQLSIEVFKEYDYSPYNCLNHMKELETGKFYIEHLGNKIPMVYAIKANKINSK